LTPEYEKALSFQFGGNDQGIQICNLAVRFVERKNFYNLVFHNSIGRVECFYFTRYCRAEKGVFVMECEKKSIK
jgi:hypothetical protein